MRIIGGQFKGRKLQTFKGTQVRPTSDRVRESLFNILAQGPRDAHVLDLFSGTGALGIEAISRGARSAVFVDISTHALAVLSKNLDHCAMHHCTRFIQWDIARNLNCLNGYRSRFDLVFMDPPYHQDLVPLAMAHLLRSQCLAPDAVLVAEHEARLGLEANPSRFTRIDSRRYGRTGLSFFSYHPE